jgi:hypothetical protein
VLTTFLLVPVFGFRAAGGGGATFHDLRVSQGLRSDCFLFSVFAGAGI